MQESPQPELKTRRLLLRPLTVTDAADIQALAGDKRIAEMTAAVPHPYIDGMAETWIGQHEKWWTKGEQVAFGIYLKQVQLVGCIGMTMNNADHIGTLGYWIGVPFWSNGYCTEAVERIIEFAFADLHLNKVYATHMSKNPASGRVMKKAGMRHVGVLRQEKTEKRCIRRSRAIRVASK